MECAGNEYYARNPAAPDWRRVQPLFYGYKSHFLSIDVTTT
jgi:hypothetical protein